MSKSSKTLKEKIIVVKDAMTLEIASDIMDLIRSSSYEEALEEIVEEHPDIVYLITGGSDLTISDVIVLNEVAMDYINNNQ
jgi:hypothetical protein